MSLVFLMRATSSFVIYICRRCAGSRFIFSWLIWSCTVRSAAASGPTLSTAGRQKNVMQLNTMNCFSSKLSPSSVGSGCTDLMKMNSKSVSWVYACTALKGSLNFWTSKPSLATIGITGMLRSRILLGIEHVIALGQVKTGFCSLPQRITFIEWLMIRLRFSIAESEFLIRFSTTAF